MDNWDVAILGAGAAGLFCGIEAARRGRRVLVLDHARAAGEKIRISGGGRCNFTNLDCRPERFLSQNPRFAISPLRRFTPRDFVARLESAGLGWVEKAAGQLFCATSARDIVDWLVRDLRDAGATLGLGVEILGVARAGDGFRVDTSEGVVSARRVVVATGGKSIPKMGATGLGYRIAEDFGLPLVETRPGLVPLTFTGAEGAAIAALAGLAVPALVTCNGARFAEPVLFTHRGLSGPAILQISSYWREGDAIEIDFLPGQDVAAALNAQRSGAGRQAVATVLGRILPERLATALVAEAGLTGRLADQPRAALQALAKVVHHRTLRPAGSEGYRTAEVTLGGVSTEALDARSLEARAVPGLHFIGEVVDVTGWLGGYNFQWAWSSGWVAGQAV